MNADNKDDMGRVEVCVQCPRCGDLFMGDVLMNTPNAEWLQWFKDQVAKARDHIRHEHVCPGTVGKST